MVISSILDNLIALVVLILLLSLIVQSVQSGLKKVLKIKSRQLEESLLDLFETVLSKDKTADGKPVSPILSMLPWMDKSLDRAADETRLLFKSVMDEFQKIGRVAQSGKLMLDSISKGDLLRVVRRVGPSTLVPGSHFEEVFQQLCDDIAALRELVKTLRIDLLTGSASASFAQLRDDLAPVINDLSVVTSNNGKINSDLIIEHVLEMRQVSLTPVFEMLGKVQENVQQQLNAAPPNLKPDLETLMTGLRNMAAKLNDIRLGADRALAPLRARIGEVEHWFDTVMQSFDERYSRGMKTWGLVVSFCVVVAMNANVLDLYTKISSNENVKNSILQVAQTIQNQAAANQPEPADPKAVFQNLQQQVGQYQGLQFQPLTWTQIQSIRQNSWLTDLKVLAGWIIMAALLSVGAPFWEDTLESLFGVKNLLRQRGEIRSVETEAGAGNPKAS